MLARLFVLLGLLISYVRAAGLVNISPSSLFIDDIDGKATIQVKLNSAPPNGAVVYWESPGLKPSACSTSFSNGNWSVSVNVDFIPIPVFNTGTNSTTFNITGYISAPGSTYHQQNVTYTIERRLASRNKCSINGDPHYYTFGGNVFSFHGQDYYHLIKSEYLDVQVKNFKCNSNGAACTEQIAVRYGNELTYFLVPNTNDLNDYNLLVQTNVNLQQTLLRKNSNSSYTIKLPDGTAIDVRLNTYNQFVHLDIDIYLVAVYKNKINGLCNTFVGTALIKRDGTTTTDATVFGNSWVVNTGENLFNCGNGKCFFPNITVVIGQVCPAVVIAPWAVDSKTISTTATLSKTNTVVLSTTSVRTVVSDTVVVNTIKSSTVVVVPTTSTRVDTTVVTSTSVYSTVTTSKSTIIETVNESVTNTKYQDVTITNTNTKTNTITQSTTTTLVKSATITNTETKKETVTSRVTDVVTDTKTIDVTNTNTKSVDVTNTNTKSVDVTNTNTKSVDVTNTNTKSVDVTNVNTKNTDTTETNTIQENVTERSTILENVTIKGTTVTEIGQTVTEFATYTATVTQTVSQTETASSSAANIPQTPTVSTTFTATKTDGTVATYTNQIGNNVVIIGNEINIDITINNINNIQINNFNTTFASLALSFCQSLFDDELCEPYVKSTSYYIVSCYEDAVISGSLVFAESMKLSYNSECQNNANSDSEGGNNSTAHDCVNAIGNCDNKCGDNGQCTAFGCACDPGYTGPYCEYDLSKLPNNTHGCDIIDHKGHAQDHKVHHHKRKHGKRYRKSYHEIWYDGKHQTKTVDDTVSPTNLPSRKHKHRYHGHKNGGHFREDPEFEGRHGRYGRGKGKGHKGHGGKGHGGKGHGGHWGNDGKDKWNSDKGEYETYTETKTKTYTVPKGKTTGKPGSNSGSDSNASSTGVVTPRPSNSSNVSNGTGASGTTSAGSSTTSRVTTRTPTGDFGDVSAAVGGTRPWIAIVVTAAALLYGAFA